MNVVFEIQSICNRVKQTFFLEQFFTFQGKQVLKHNSANHFHSLENKNKIFIAKKPNTSSANLYK